MRSVGIQKCAGNIYNFFASPGKNKSWSFCNYSYRNRLQVFLVCITKHFIYIFWIYNNRHTLLGFGNRKLCSIQTGIFLRHFIKIHTQSVCQFTDCNGYTAGTKVITFFNQTADFFSAEQSLNLTLCRSITFLYFCTTGINRLCIVGFRRSCRSTTAISSGSSPKKNDDIIRIRIFTNYIFTRSSTHNGTDFQTFCHIVRMIDLIYQSCCKTNLVTIRTISAGSTCHDLSLWQFPFQCLFQRFCRICSTGNTHCLINVATS